MSFVSLILSLPLVFALPDPLVSWTNAEHDAVKVEVAPSDELVSQCLDAGLEVRVRYEMRVCRRRVMWADSCEERRVQIHTVQYDPIREGYRVSADRLGDTSAPKVNLVAERFAALSLVFRIPELRLQDIGFSIEQFPMRKAPFFGVRALADCKGDYNETLARISSFLTLGLIDFGSSDSGWVDFRILAE
jgi:hypothetical protein